MDMGQEEANPDGRLRARWSSLAFLGLLMVALGPLLMFVGGLLWGLELSGDSVFFLGVAAVALIGAILVRTFGGWAKIVGIITAILAMGAMFWTAFGIAIPSSFFDFVPGILMVPGGLLAIVSCIASLVAGRRGHRAAAATGGERGAIRVVVGLVVILMAVSGVLTYTGRSVAAAAGADETILARDLAFEPQDLELEPGSTVLIRADDPFFHTFTIDELGIDEQLTPGDEALVQIPDEPGTYVFYCIPHTREPENPGEDDMAGELRIG
jgi:plastocyanin